MDMLKSQTEHGLIWVCLKIGDTHKYMHFIGKNDPFELGKNPIFSDNEMHIIGKMNYLNWGKTLFSIGSHRKISLWIFMTPTKIAGTFPRSSG